MVKVFVTNGSIMDHAGSSPHNILTLSLITFVLYYVNALYLRYSLNVNNVEIFGLNPKPS